MEDVEISRIEKSFMDIGTGTLGISRNDPNSGPTTISTEGFRWTSTMAESGDIWEANGKYVSEFFEISIIEEPIDESGRGPLEMGEPPAMCESSSEHIGGEFTAGTAKSDRFSENSKEKPEVEDEGKKSNLGPRSPPWLTWDTLSGAKSKTSGLASSSKVGVPDFFPWDLALTADLNKYGDIVFGILESDSNNN